MKNCEHALTRKGVIPLPDVYEAKKANFAEHFFNNFGKILQTKMYSTKNALFGDDV